MADLANITRRQILKSATAGTAVTLPVCAPVFAAEAAQSPTDRIRQHRDALVAAINDLRKMQGDHRCWLLWGQGRPEGTDVQLFLYAEEYDASADEVIEHRVKVEI